MKEALLCGEIDEIGQILHYGWQHKKQMAEGISNPMIDNIYETAMAAGATGGKISGAGGGGFMIFYAPYTNKYNVIKELNKLGGKVMRYTFTNIGLTTWTI
jgi:D-glycero-alpha-D-manno-heptose-7-phosphate kinase